MILNLLLGLCAALVAVPAAVLCLQVVLGACVRRSPQRPAPLLTCGPVAVLVPAHDEAQGLAPTLAALKVQLRSTDRLIVIADNCTDATAAVGRACGAEVVERHDTAHRGKGYALAFGMAHLRAAPPAIVVIVDADCHTEPGALGHLCAAVQAHDRPVQARYLMRAPQGAGAGQRVAEFAWRVKNHLRPAGLGALGLPCALQGSGMAFPYDLLAAAPLASGNLVEDLVLGLDLAERGRPPRFCPEARVNSLFPLNREGAQSQRTRWEHGHLQTVLARAPSMLRRAVQRASLPLLAVALDLCVPPLALLVMLNGLVLGLCVVGWAWLGASVVPLALALSALALLCTAVGVAWLRAGRDVVSVLDLLGLPVYAARKIPLYLRFALRRQQRWVRARRDVPDAGDPP